MKQVQISEHVWRLGIWMIIPINVWVVKGDNGITLVDAGLASMSKGILKFIQELNAGPLERILLTHGHSDHVGAIPRILEHQSVPVYADRIELPYLEGQEPYPRRKKAVASLAANLVQPIPETDGRELTPIGDLIPYRTPGHSPGHVAYYHRKDGVLLAGDLFTSSRGQLRPPIPMFTADMEEAVESGSIVQKLKPKLLSVCHGQEVKHPHQQYEQYHQGMLQKLSVNA